MSEAPGHGAGLTRRQALCAGGGAIALAAGAGALIAPAGGEAATEPVLTDADRLRRLVAVELLSLYCFDHIVAAGLLSPRALHLIAPLHAHEAVHVRVLGRHLVRLGGIVPPGPADVRQADRDLARRAVAGRLGQLTGGKDALHLLLDLEKVVVGAHFVALTKLADPRLATLVAQIMAADAQSEALLGEALYPGKASEAVPSGLVQGIQ